jgi:hypothetical protein
MRRIVGVALSVLTLGAAAAAPANASSGSGCRGITTAVSTQGVQMQEGTSHSGGNALHSDAAIYNTCG